MKHVASILLVSLPGLLLATATAHAQMGMGGMRPGGGMMPGMPPPSQGRDPGEDGPAEKAPDEGQTDSDLEPIGPFPGQARRAQFIELDGLMRVRTEFLRRLDLGQGYLDPNNPAAGTPPFPTALDCGIHTGPCREKYLAGGNLRLRLEPIIHVTEQVRVMTQVDVLDNLVMGSTPDSTYRVTVFDPANNLAPHPVLSNTQSAPELGANGFMSSVRAKRAWGVVESEFGQLQFGRMPWHWGRGMFFNDGACWDCDGQTNVDRLLGMTQLYGHRVALAWDFGAAGSVWSQTAHGLRDLQGPPLDLSQRDDVLQLMASVAKLDDDETFRARAAVGELAVNYGFQLVYRYQGAALYPAEDAGAPAPMAGGALTRDQLSELYTSVNAVVFIPDLWFKLAWRGLTVEFEGAGVVGKIGNAGPLAENPRDKALNLRQAGWVLATDLALFRNSFFIGFETGGATGDKAENGTTYLNHRWKTVRQPVGDRTIADFRFSPEYHVDQILFRRLYGTVSNAMYFKPQLAYWLSLGESRQLGLLGSGIYSLAMERLSTPGDARSYGIELNLGATYRNTASGFYGGLVWGVLWPLSALERLRAGDGSSAPFREKAESAQVLRLLLGVQF